MVGISFSIALSIVVTAAVVATLAAAAVDYVAFIILRYRDKYTAGECLGTSSMEQIVHYYVGLSIAAATPD